MRTHLVAVVMLACSRWMTSKAQTGGVQGTETDPSGAVAANTKVTATNVDTGVATISTTDNGGIYNINIRFLQIGSYKVRSRRRALQWRRLDRLYRKPSRNAKVDGKLALEGPGAESIRGV
jgi:hypothetical protein